MAEPMVFGQGSSPRVIGIERRAAVRHACRKAIGCAPLPEVEDAPWSARVQDISGIGIGLVMDRYFEPETLLSVDFPSAGPIPTFTFLVQVVNARAQSDTEWILGCTFARELSAEELGELV
jgi:hypothetical protein